MVPAIEYFRQTTAPANQQADGQSAHGADTAADVATIKAPTSLRLILSNGLLGLTIEGVDGAVIGRRHGIYQTMFSRFPYVSGSHAQLKFDSIKNRWTVTDMNSSNGSKYNGTPLQPEVPCILENGATLQLANITLTVAII